MVKNKTKILMENPSFFVLVEVFLVFFFRLGVEVFDFFCFFCVGGGVFFCLE